jgi:hypothetical protein
VLPHAKALLRPLIFVFFTQLFRDMKKNWINMFFAAVLVVVLSGTSSPVAAQCPMCKMSAESNLKNGGTAGRGLNAGILYMLITPYVLVGSIGYWWWRNRRKGQDDPDAGENANTVWPHDDPAQLN